MSTQEEIRERFKHKNLAFQSREIQEIAKILWEDEDIEDCIPGNYENGFGLLAATNKRLIFIDKKLFGVRIEDFSYEKITSIQYHSGLLMGELTIYASGNKATIKHLEKASGAKFSDFVRARISAPAAHASSSVAIKNEPDRDPYAEVEKLASLMEKGIVTEEEFQKKKKQLLGL